MNEVMQQIINQFPNQAKSIRQLWLADEDFQELCHDYALCLETLSEWLTAATSSVRTAEYHSLCRRLELEIEMKINLNQFH